MGQDIELNPEHVKQLGLEAIRMAYGIKGRDGTGAGPFDGSQHRPSGQPGGGRFRTKAGRSHASETLPPKFSRPLLADGQRLTAFVRQYISELRGLEQAWVAMCYRDRGKIGGTSWAKFRNTYCAAYEADQCKGARPGTRAIVREMIAFRMRQMAGSIPPHAKFESENFTISRQAWHITYKDHWERICDDLYRIDDNVRYKVGIKVFHH